LCGPIPIRGNRGAPGHFAVMLALPYRSGITETSEIEEAKR
jgi:hypothetical protein